MSKFVTVTIPQGTLRGKVVTSASTGVTYCSFQGIPYAKPPVGPLRFKPPEDPEPWTGIKDAMVHGAVAPQIDEYSQKFIGDENCLFLNVYTQRLKKSTKAVMVWIHSGGFVMGSGNDTFHGPDYLITEDVVLVTINYRLGALGFLYSENADIIGNNGLRDQVMALKWVKKNIAHFGGDPGNVAIFGESAGSVSVHLLMLSPLASGLFHKVIAQSGTALLANCYSPSHIMSLRTARLAKLLGCTSKDPKEVVKFLSTVPSKDLVEKQIRSLLESDVRPLEVPFAPCEEVGPEAFLPASPIKLLQEGKFEKVPFITGITSAEGKIMLYRMFRKVNLSFRDRHFYTLLPLYLSQNISAERSKEVADTIRKFYFGDRALSDATLSQYIDMMSDLSFVFPAYLTVQLQNKWTQHPTYVYLFDHWSREMNNVFQIAKNDHPGAPHAAELNYLFKTSALPDTSLKCTGSSLGAKLVKLWTQFAKTGNPSSGEVNIPWIPATKEKFNYLKINGGFNMYSDMYKGRMEFLQDLYFKTGFYKSAA